jgi:hypothetical protein
VVVDGNSSDRTREIVNTFDVTLVSDNGKGKGSALI